MAKINHEEYKILKGLDNGWRWVARDENNSLWAYSKEPDKKPYGWLSRAVFDKELDKERFQFIRWEDEEPYNIQELIEGYEYSADHVSHVVNERVKALGNAWKESEETEVKKGIEWLKEEIRRHDKGYIYKDDLMKIINGVDETEVLSQEWINEHSNGLSHSQYVWVSDLKELLVQKQEITEEQAYDTIAESFPASAKEIKLVLEKYYSSMLIEFSEELHESIVRAFDVEATSKTIEMLTGMTLEQIAEEARDGKIVLKKEKLVVPKYVAKWMEQYTEYGFDLYPALKRLESNALNWKSVYEWYRKNTCKFVNAYLTKEYEMEEQKYVIKLDDESYLQKYEIDNKNIVTPFRIVGHLKEVAIKFDNRKKAEMVAELVEGKVEELEE